MTQGSGGYMTQGSGGYIFDAIIEPLQIFVGLLGIGKSGDRHYYYALVFQAMHKHAQVSTIIL